MKGIVLAGGSGSRLHPLTLVVSKQLMPVYDKPMIYSPISTLMLAGVRDILIISTPEDLPRFEALLGSGKSLGVRFSYKEQPRPEGLAQAFILAEDFVGDDTVALILGDNLFYGHGFGSRLREAAELQKGGIIFAHRVKDPERYGVVVFDEDKRALKIVEKPKTPISPWAVPGLYFYDNQVVEFAKSLRPSERGELEITDINRLYMERGELSVTPLGRGVAWLDTGTHESLLAASDFIGALQRRQGLKVGCIEEVAYRMGYISSDDVVALGRALGNSPYGQYLIDLKDEEL